MMDNASVHKVDEVKQLIEKLGASVVFLPPYIPDLNPIELAWNKIKTYLRKKRARTADELYEAYAKALKLVTVEDSKKFIAHSMVFLK